MASVPSAAPTLLPSGHVGRADLVSEVVSHLTAPDAAGALYVLTGMGGGGKTVRASSVVRTMEARQHCRQGMFWVRVGCRGKDQLQALSEGIAREMNVFPTVPHRFNSLDDVIQHLTLVVGEDASLCLVVLDDVWERGVVDTLRPTGLQLLVTTRRGSVVDGGGGRTVVGNMDRKEARELLKSKRGAKTHPETEADQGMASCVKYS